MQDTTYQQQEQLMTQDVFAEIQQERTHIVQQVKLIKMNILEALEIVSLHTIEIQTPVKQEQNKCKFEEIKILHRNEFTFKF